MNQSHSPYKRKAASNLRNHSNNFPFDALVQRQTQLLYKNMRQTELTRYPSLNSVSQNPTVYKLNQANPVQKAVGHATLPVVTNSRNVQMVGGGFVTANQTPIKEHKKY